LREWSNRDWMGIVGVESRLNQKVVVTHGSGDLWPVRRVLQFSLRN